MDKGRDQGVGVLIFYSHRGVGVKQAGGFPRTKREVFGGTKIHLFGVRYLNFGAIYLSFGAIYLKFGAIYLSFFANN